MSNFTYEELEHMGGFDCESRGTIPVKVLKNEIVF